MSPARGRLEFFPTYLSEGALLVRTFFQCPRSRFNRTCHMREVTLTCNSVQNSKAGQLHPKLYLEAWLFG